MALIIVLDAVVVIWLVMRAQSRGFEEVLPGAAFVLLLVPNESQLEFASLFDLTTHRLVILTLILLWVVRDQESALKGAPGLPLKALLIAVAGWMTLSTANSVVPSISFKATLSQILDFFVVYVLYYKGTTRKQTVEKILNSLVLAMLASSVFGAVEAYTGWSVLSVFPTQTSRFSELAGGLNDRGARVQSTFGHPILFGATLAMTIPGVIYLLEKAETRRRQVLLWAALLLMVLCTYKTGSRGPWLAFGFALAALFMAGTRWMRKAIAAMALLAVMVMMLRPGVGKSIGNIYAATGDPTSPEGQSYQWRWMLYGLAQRELAKDSTRMLWGYGPESFYYLNLTAPFLVDGEERTVKVLSCDSAVVELMMDLGYGGLILIAAIFAKTAWKGAHFYLECDPAERMLPLVLLLSLAVFCFMMTNVEIYAWGQQNYMLWIVVATLQALPGLHDDHAQRAESVPLHSTSESLERFRPTNTGQTARAKLP